MIAFATFIGPRLETIELNNVSASSFIIFGSCHFLCCILVPTHETSKFKGHVATYLLCY